MRPLPLALAALTLAAPAAAQPYSTSMAQCAALTRNVAQWVTTEDAEARLMAATRLWQRAAVSRAQLEGVPDAAQQVAQVMARQSREWERGGAAFFYTQEFVDWTDYCRKFAQAQNIDLTP